MPQTTGICYAIASDMVTGDRTWEQPVLRSCRPIPIPQGLKQLLGEHHIAIFPAFALLDTKGHAFVVDVMRLERDRFRDTQAGGIADGENRTGFASWHAAQELPYFLRAQDHRQCFGLFGGRNDLFDIPVPLQR
jgi:hypothetical protein